ncbi:MAG: L-lactate permease [Puniceicoccales bacterium]|jgi:lactate permease|nr:L-lactate permease [Puniceicoccales bacterium]
MSTNVLAIAGLLPILVALVLMVGLHFGAAKAMGIAWLTCALSAIWLWGLPPSYVLALSLQGVSSAVSVLIIVFGALLLLHTLQYSGGMETIQRGMESISKDMRVQAIIVGYMFSTFIEGAAGFGAPVALAAHLLIALGFPPLAAAILCLILNSFSVTFGAVGIPIITGFGASLQAFIEGAVATGSFQSPSHFLKVIGQAVALMHIPMVFILPIFTLGFIARFFGPNRSWKDGFAAWKFCLFAATAFAIPFLLFAWFMGPEMPSIAGGLIGLAAVMFGAKRGFCVPKDVWTFGEVSKWEKEWIGDSGAGEKVGCKPQTDFLGKRGVPSNLQDPEKEDPECSIKSPMRQFTAWMPYVLIGIILMLTRIDLLPLKALFNRYGVINFTDILGYKGVNENSIKLLYSPGTIPFMLIAILTIFMHGMSREKVAKAWRETFVKMKTAAISLCASVALVKVFQGSGNFTNPELIAQLSAAGVDSNILSMPRAMAEAIGGIVGSVWPIFAAYVGGLGTFITGSNTVSNVLFAQFQCDMAELQNLSRIVILAAQGAGGAMGSMICVHNIVAVSAVVGLLNREGDILKKTFLPFLIYGIFVSIVAYMLIAIGCFAF